MKYIDYQDDLKKLNEVHSFVCRHRKLTKNQNNALNNYASLIGIPYQKKMINFQYIFNNEHPVILEIGFGIGHSLIRQAINNPDNNFIGIEVYLPGIASCLNLAIKSKAKNLRIIYYNAIKVLNQMIPNNSLWKMQLFFPDPWPKNKHHKRRIVNIDFAQLVLRKLNFGGYFHIATDCCSYANYIFSIMKTISTDQAIFYESTKSCLKSSRPTTKFEQKANNLGYPVQDLIYQKMKR
ncbi:MAG: tRNA (guanosine(46)-N7)-methyltransferase TrmB [Candidatus Dasytiphilus stammeri]